MDHPAGRSDEQWRDRVENLRKLARDYSDLNTEEIIRDASVKTWQGEKSRQTTLKLHGDKGLETHRLLEKALAHETVDILRAAAQDLNDDTTSSSRWLLGLRPISIGLYLLVGLLLTSAHLGPAVLAAFALSSLFAFLLLFYFKDPGGINLRATSHGSLHYARSKSSAVSVAGGSLLLTLGVGILAISFAERTSSQGILVADLQKSYAELQIDHAGTMLTINALEERLAAAEATSESPTHTGQHALEPNAFHADRIKLEQELNEYQKSNRNLRLAAQRLEGPLQRAEESNKSLAMEVGDLQAAQLRDRETIRELQIQNQQIPHLKDRIQTLESDPLYQWARVFEEFPDLTTTQSRGPGDAVITPAELAQIKYVLEKLPLFEDLGGTVSIRPPERKTKGKSACAPMFGPKSSSTATYHAFMARKRGDSAAKTGDNRFAATAGFTQSVDYSTEIRTLVDESGDVKEAEATTDTGSSASYAKFVDCAIEATRHSRYEPARIEIRFPMWITQVVKKPT